ncbi:MAG: hypothetical protein JSS56_15930 [Proteobacteria bacterium]|nr:hypothetical protein [Pseudomonadota bacterium]
MAASLGALVVSLGLDAASFTSGMTKAEFQARKFGEQLGEGLRTAGALAVAGLATVGTAAITAAGAFDTLIKQAGDFQDLAEKTGGSAEGLASLAVAAGTAGVSMDAIAGASVKLTKNLTGVDDESKDAGAALKALGINIEEFKALKPEDQMVALASSLAGFEDGAGKTAVAVALLGKSGADALPFLKALDEQGGKHVILTAEMIAQADEYSDKQAKSRAELNLYAQALATQALPAMTAFTGAATDMIKEILGVDKGTKDLANSTAVQDFAEKAVRALAFVVDAADGVIRVFEGAGKTIGAALAQVGALASGDLKGSIAIGKEWQKDMQDILNRPLFSSKLNARLEQQKQDAANAAKFGFGNRPGTGQQLNFQGATKGGGGAGDDPTKKILDNQLKALENAANDERDILASRNKMLDLYNGAALISTKDYYAGRRAAAEEAVSNQSAIYDQEISALQAFMARAGKATDREAAQGKINDLLSKKAKLYRDAAEAAVESSFKEQKAAEDLARQINAVNAEVLELTGNMAAASRIRLDDQFSELTKRLTANGDTAGLAQVSRLKQLKQAQAEYGQQSEQVGQITESLRIQEERIQLSRQLGADSELSSLIKLREARSGAVEQMRAMVEAQEAIANASGNPKLVQQAERARLELDKLAATADPLADKFNNLIGEAGANAFSDFISGAKSAKEAMKSFGDEVANQLARMASEALFKQLMGGLLGSTGGSAGSIGGWLSSLFGAASGGMLMPGEMRRVNENGPELLDVNGKQYLMNGSRNATVTSNSKIGSSGGSSYINITVPGNTDGRTALQIADKTALRQRQARRYA